MQLAHRDLQQPTAAGQDTPSTHRAPSDPSDSALEGTVPTQRPSEPSKASLRKDGVVEQVATSVAVLCLGTAPPYTCTAG